MIRKNQLIKLVKVTGCHFNKYCKYQNGDLGPLVLALTRTDFNLGLFN